MSFWVYLLRCADGSYYAGHTDNLEVRIAQHNAGEIAGYTQRRRPVQLVYSEDFATRGDALAAERQIKGWSRKKKEALIRCDWDELRRLARGRSRAVDNSAHETEKQQLGRPSTSSGRTDKNTLSRT